MSGDVGLTEALAEHRRNDVPEPQAGVPHHWRVKCDGRTCNFYAEAERWWDVCALHEAHVAEVLERIVAERVREAEQRGAVQALRDAAEDADRSTTLGWWPAMWLRARADYRLASS